MVEPRIGIIACDNGLGHVRRVALVAEALARQGAAVTVLAREEQGARFGLRVVGMETCTSTESLRRGDDCAINWYSRLPNLDDFDLVVSDNLPEILHVRTDAVLMGSFLWHLVVEGADEKYVRSSQRLLEAYRPLMIGTGLFASDELRRLTRFEDVGLFCRPPVAGAGKTDLLVACGRSGLCEGAVEQALAALLRRGRGPFATVHVEPRLLPADAPAWMTKADFTPGMYARLAAAVVRPGVGTLTELIQAGCPAFCFYESGNREMVLNATRVASAGLGLDCGSVQAALDGALSHGTSPSPRHDGLPPESFDGAGRSARLLISHVSH